MEPNKFEKEFREKLNEREINPSNDAWDRLDAMLNVAEETKPKRKYTWMYVAAGFVGFLLISTIYFSQRETPINNLNDTVVVKEEQAKDTVVKPNKVEDKIILKSLSTDAVVIKDAKKNTEERNEKINQNKINQNQVAERSIIKEANNENWKNNQNTETKNNQTVIADNSKSATVDQLLTSAEKTLVIGKPDQQKAKVKINANDLLSQVDGELELSFREKVINKVNKNYQTVKVALANRNAEE
ncbi:hypothetical protein [Flavobacterium hydatis]|uniref:Uncharacterized protein n=1 Tax=Flavobacterium hydatis TaxID=991 RepID=A0A086ATD6_FLAHY|nr:hypothetical protein [Flavobacterium hydatis]KFF19950.1 hypothetical protein IW20_02140 [Flavobacterium hydatis]OXA91485.1 hypothetical protein B0A62_17565 [Flavobacterium hydatis]